MKAIVQDAYGTADRLELREIDRPVPRADEVLVRIHAAGVDPSVWHLMTGQPYIARLALGVRRPRQRVRGWNLAGIVEQVGAEVKDLEPGAAVFGDCRGSFAEYACTKPDKLVPKPANLSFEQAAALPVSGMTALQALRDKARLREGQRVLVIGASGGVGSYAVQLAAALGAGHITAVCGPGRAELVRSLGADEVIDHTSREITDGPHPYDVILDVAGNRPLPLLRRVLAPRGTLVIAGGEGGGRVTGGMGRQLRATLLSPFVRQRLINLISLTRRSDLLTLKELAEAGRITPVIDRTFPLAEAADAVSHLEKGRPAGKIVLSVAGSGSGSGSG